MRDDVPLRKVAEVEIHAEGVAVATKSAKLQA